MRSVFFLLGRRAQRMCLPLLMLALAAGGIGAPASAQAHWGVCLDDPKVWLDSGAKVDMSTTIAAPASSLAGLSFTLHVPPGTQATKIVRTAGVDPSFEQVTVVADAQNGPWAEVYATSLDGSTYAVSLDLHIVDNSSTWISSDGVTNEPVGACLTGCSGA